MQTQSRCWGASVPCGWAGGGDDLMQAAGGWRSCAEGVLTSQSAASASSVLSSEEQREREREREHEDLLVFVLNKTTHPVPLLLMHESSVRPRVTVGSFSDWRRSSGGVSFCHVSTNTVQTLHNAELKIDSSEILPSYSSKMWSPLTKAAVYKLLILKLNQKKFQRSSKAHQS